MQTKRGRWLEADHHGAQLARGLGLFSIGLGLTEVAAPRRMARLIGIADDRRTREAMIALGVREIASGVALLSQPRRPAWVWSRVVGDVIDLVLLGLALRTKRRNGHRLGVAIGAVLGVLALDVLGGRKVQRESR